MSDRPTNDDIIAAWSAAATHADDFGAEGDEPRRLLLNPAIFAMLGAVHVHRPLSHYLNLLIQVGCMPRRMEEPGLGAEWTGRGAWYERNQHVPSYLIIHATRG